MTIAGMFARHIPASPPLRQSGVLTVHEPIHSGNRRSIGRSMDRPHQKPRHIECLGTEVALHAVRAPRESRRTIRILLERVEYGTPIRIHGSQVNDPPAQDPPDRDVVAEIHGPRSLGISVVSL